LSTQSIIEINSNVYQKNLQRRAKSNATTWQQVNTET